MDPYEMVKELRNALGLPDRELHDLPEEWEDVVRRVTTIRSNLMASAT